MNFKKSWILTEDGSHTLKIEDLKETYHSLHGALRESEFVYLEKGLHFWQKANPQAKCRLLEMGYGTGLLAYLTFLRNTESSVDYTSLEAYPLTVNDYKKLNYNELLVENTELSYVAFSALSWEIAHPLTPTFTLIKHHTFFEQFTATHSFDLIYYDAFGAHAQPALWEKKWMEKCFSLLSIGGVWVSYCAKGSVRRALQEVGFSVERLEGPPGKREMLRAVKP
ncbi:MAG: tRNA (5-methylaminomethyl-2-thiouridine)(34)-methyltransferase MnmD [Flavobacteriaceae bacterium]